MKTTHYLTTCPIKDWKIAPECEKVFIGTAERKERYERIVAKNKVLVAVPTVKKFIQNLN